MIPVVWDSSTKPTFPRKCPAYVAALYAENAVGLAFLMAIGNYDFIAGLPLTGMKATFVREGAMNGDIFQAYVEHVFVPTMSPGDIVVLDNLPAHKVPRAQKGIKQVGARMAVPRTDSSGFTTPVNAWRW